MATKSVQLHDPGGTATFDQEPDDTPSTEATVTTTVTGNEMRATTLKGDSDSGVAVVRTTVNLQPEAVTALREIASDRGTTVAEVIRRAIWIEKYLHDAIKAGGKVLLQDPDRTLRELVIR